MTSTGAGLMHVWKLVVNNEIAYGAIDGKKDPKARLIHPAGYLGFLMIPGVIIIRNAFTDPAYLRKGICSELMLFVNQVEKHKIMSDIFSPKK